LEDGITARVVEVVKGKLENKTERPIYRSKTEDSEAYTAFLKGRFHWNRRTTTNLKKSIGYFTEAIDIDPGFASAYAGLSDAQIILGMYGVFSPRDVMPRAKDSAVRALKVDERLAEAHVALGCIEAVHYWRWGIAEREFKRGIELDPSYATGHHWYSVNHLIPLGRFEEAIAEINQALLLDPVSLPINASIGLTYYFARDYDRSAEELKKTLEMDTGFPMTNFFLAQTYSQQGKYEEALSHFRTALDLYGQSPNMLASYGYTAAVSGQKSIAEGTLDQLIEQSKERYVSTFDLAVLLLGLGKKREALEQLQQACEERAFLLIYLNVSPVLDSLRTEPEFENLKQRIFRGVFE
jgi:tetratricopeptide (TPR) repeat protein